MNNCPICSSKNNKAIIRWKKYTIHKCKSCKLVFSEPLPTDEELAEFYQGFMFNIPFDFEIEKQVSRRLDELKELFNLTEDKQLTINKKFLDFGGGTGIVYKTASDIGFDTYYHDLDVQAKEFTKNRFGLKEEKIIEDIEHCNTKFDYIFSDNVIEHVKDPCLFVKVLVDRLGHGGRLVIKTPNASNTESIFNPLITVKSYFLIANRYNSLKDSIKAYFMRIWHCDPPRHIYSFSNGSLKQLMNDFESEKIEYSISYYRTPLFDNTITKQFFTKDKRLNGLKSVLVRLVIWPVIPIETVLQFLKWFLLKLKIVSPGGIILTVNKMNAS